MLRNYNASMGKWMTSDPIGYPDGWNNLIYCLNSPSIQCDIIGGNVYVIIEHVGWSPSKWIPHVSLIVQNENGTATLSWGPLNHLDSLDVVLDKSKRNNAKTYILKGLNEQAMMQYIHTAPKGTYWLGNACGDQAIDALAVGGSMQYLKYQDFTGLFAMPHEVENYVKELQVRLNSKQGIDKQNQNEKLSPELKGNEFDLSTLVGCKIPAKEKELIYRQTVLPLNNSDLSSVFIKYQFSVVDYVITEYDAKKAIATVIVVYRRSKAIPLDNYAVRYLKNKKNQAALVKIKRFIRKIDGVWKADNEKGITMGEKAL